MSNTSVGQSDVDPAIVKPVKEQIITYLFVVIGVAFLIFGIANLNNWRAIDPDSIATARVEKETGLAKAQEVALYQAQFEKAQETKSAYFRLGAWYIIFGLVFYFISRRWRDWRQIFGERMLYVYAFVPILGWLLYLAYPTKGDKTRKIIRRNIGIMSFVVVVGFLAYYLTILLQAFVLSPLGNSVAVSDFLVGIFNFLLAPQIAQLMGIAVGGYIAFSTKDVRAISVAAQLVVLAIVLAILGWLGSNAAAGIESRGLSATDYNFLGLTAGFDISEHLIEYDRTFTYGRAFFVGALNTLLVSLVGIFFSTILGLFVGIARLSTNWLLSSISRAFVEAMRNVPLLVLMFFFYAGVLLQLPQREDTLHFFGSQILLNNRGAAFAWFKPTETFNAWIPFLVVALIVAGVIWYFRNRNIPQTGRPAFSGWYILLGFVAVAAIGIPITHPLIYQQPFIDGFNYAKDEEQHYIGLVLTPEFFGVLLSLVLYTGAYIGEVVRAGIQAVSKGQREAATAIGLTQSQSMQLIILPQALQVVIPPLTNQYLNLAKNSSLAIAIGYADLFAVATTTFNQSGQSVQVILMIMASYLTLSLSISVVMNAINSRIKIKER